MGVKTLALLAAWSAVAAGLKVTLHLNGVYEGGVEVDVDERAAQAQASFPFYLSTLLSSADRARIFNDAEDYSSSRLFNQRGEEIKAWRDAHEGDDVYVLRHDLNFIWPGVRVGHRQQVTGMTGVPEGGIWLETLSVGSEKTGKPAVFFVENLLDTREVDELLNHSLSLKGPAGFAVSTTGEEDEGTLQIDKERTSDNLWDTASRVSVEIFRRSFQILRMPYSGPADNKIDGIQVLRYQRKQFYNPHHDWLPVESLGYNYDPSRSGSNRFATVFTFLSDVIEGGQTAFPDGDAPDLSMLSPHLRPLLNSFQSKENATKLADSMTLGHKEREMVTVCYSKLSVRPKKGAAILFYNQLPTNKVDIASLHGGCPVLQGTKYSANVWIWNKDRFTNHPRTGVDPSEQHEVKIIFTNRSGKDGKFYWRPENGDDVFMEDLEHGSEQTSFTWHGHTFVLKVEENGEERDFWVHTVDASIRKIGQRWIIPEGPVNAHGLVDSVKDQKQPLRRSQVPTARETPEEAALRASLAARLKEGGSSPHDEL